MEGGAHLRSGDRDVRAVDLVGGADGEGVMTDSLQIIIAGLTERAERAEEMVTAWKFVMEGVCAHIEDRMAMRDPASPETYLRIIQSDVANVQRDGEQFVKARWHDAQVARGRAQRTEAENARLREALTDARAFVQAELNVRVDSHTLGDDMSTLDDVDSGMVGEAIGCLTRIDAALAAPAGDQT